SCQRRWRSEPNTAPAGTAKRAAVGRRTASIARGASVHGAARAEPAEEQVQGDQTQNEQDRMDDRASSDCDHQQHYYHNQPQHSISPPWGLTAGGNPITQ